MTPPSLLENSVPEPAGILLIGLGKMIMLLLRRRNRLA
ncbi:PEP-CTERM sorting domain-containing protein [Nitrosomonas mobilis]